MLNNNKKNIISLLASTSLGFVDYTGASVGHPPIALVTSVDVKSPTAGFYSANQYAVLIGSGSTGVSVTDYTLESIVTEYNTLSLVKNPSTTDSVASLVLIKTMQSTSATNIVVGEAGLFGSTYLSGAGLKVVMLERVVFKPVTVQPGETFTVRLDINFL